MCFIHVFVVVVVVFFPMLVGQPPPPSHHHPQSGCGVFSSHHALRRLSHKIHVDGGSAALYTKQEDELFIMNCDIDGDLENQVEMEEKTRLINQVLELQHTLEDLSARVDAVKEENLKLKSENQVLGQYIENLMSASSVFQTTDTKSKRK
ncbi:short coiled-coil protein A isoform X1 [Embiotoca jacksoni]|uniref:short coiled-coil protein A isoform X1 n=1 Tax=Embiotoca jacksoni TaxID=100190 RepID=UPI003704A084